MSTSAVPLLLDALVSTFTTALATASLTAGPIVVYDGPTTSRDPQGEFVVVGDNGDVTDDAEASRTEQQWAGIGGRSKDETGGITCAVVCWSGDSEFKPLRDRAFVLLGLLETALRANPQLGVLGPPGHAQIETVDLRQVLVGGAVVRLVITVTFQARI